MQGNSSLDPENTEFTHLQETVNLGVKRNHQQKSKTLYKLILRPIFKSYNLNITTGNNRSEVATVPW